MGGDILETYFKLKTIFTFVIPAVIIGLLIIGFLYAIMKSWRKSKLMERLGYTYNRRLGDNVALEFQPHWEKGKIEINCRKIDALKYKEIKEFVKSKEQR